MTHARRVVIVGGGMGGLSAAWRLSEPGWQANFESITVLERGFRLGGKGASSRGRNGRIEEHGLHVWLGHYDNGFRVMRDCYEELDRQRTDPQCPDPHLAGRLRRERPARPLRPWIERLDAVGRPVLPNRLVPGDPDADGRGPSLTELLLRSALLLRDFYASLEVRAGPRHHPVDLAGAAASVVRQSDPRCRRDADRRQPAAVALLAARDTAAGRAAGRRCDRRRVRAPADPPLGDHAYERRRPRAVHALVDLVRGGARRDGGRRPGGDRDAYDAINHLDFRDWLRRHGAHPSTLQSAIVRGQYDLVFSHENGDPARPQVRGRLGCEPVAPSSGSTTRARSSGRCARAWAKPCSRRCTRRSSPAACEFRFLHEVTDLLPAGDGRRSVAVVDAERWPPAGPGRTSPLTRVKGLPCFPSAPDGQPPSCTGPRGSWRRATTSTCWCSPSRRPPRA